MDILSAVDRASTQMIESAFEKQEQATYWGRSEGANGELEIAKLEIETIKTNLHLVQKHERYLQQRHGKLSRQLGDIDKVLTLTPNHTEVLDQEYKTARYQWLNSQALRALSFYGPIEKLDKTVEFSREELAAEKAHVAELQNRSRV